MQWRARPLFISSTFNDFQAERDLLQNLVFPDLAERLRERRHDWEPIDLRLGVDTASEADEVRKTLLVLDVCLHEAARSRPFFIALIGDRYGWVPPPERARRAAEEAGLADEVSGKSVTTRGRSRCRRGAGLEWFQAGLQNPHGGTFLLAVTLLAAALGTAEMTPIASADFGAKGWQEAVVTLGLSPSGFHPCGVGAPALWFQAPQPTPWPGGHREHGL